MSKIKKFTLSFDDELDFDVIGLTSHQMDFRLVWYINNHLGIHLTKSDKKLPVYNEKKDEDILFPYFNYHDELDRIGYYLVKNKNGIDFLIPESTSIDYFLFLTNNYAVDINNLIKKLRQIETVLGVFAFDNQKIKSFQNIEFN
jgi:hypothetical protein